MLQPRFHPAVRAWFDATFDAPTGAQVDAWAAIGSGHNALIAAPTGSGKTLAAFLAAIDALVHEACVDGLPDETRVVYVSPLKALSNDIRLNLEQPLDGIRAVLQSQGLPDVEIRALARTGDTPQAERGRMRKRPPHILVTTPESLYILLGSESGRAMLASTRSVIVDEIHALMPSKRGSHLALSLERLQALCSAPLQRIGLSATQKPIDEVARFLVGTAPTHEDIDCTIVDVGHSRLRDLAIELPSAPLEAVMSGEVWQQVHARLAALVLEHRTTLVFVNTRRMAERIARHLGEILGKEQVAAHHGSLAREHRLLAEQRLKRGELRVLVATASLELGIDIGEVDLVCQIGSPRSIASLLQRVGRSGHAVDGTPKGRLFPQSRDELVECVALLDCIRRGELDAIAVVRNPLDVLAQQIVAEVACAEWNEDELFELVRRAYPFAQLPREDYAAVVRMLADGVTTRHGPRAGLLHRDAVHHQLRGRIGAQLTALTSGGTIPDTADYDVVLEPQAQKIGSVNEDFAVESLAGDVFQLGNASYRILRIERNRVRVEDAHGMPPSIPFWLGEAPARSDELSHGVSRLRSELSARLDDGDETALRWLVDDIGASPIAARQLVDYLGAAKAAFGMLPTQTQLAMERFFDESGGTQLIIHSPFGSRVNRAWGLALRKRFCRTFNFELQAAATEDAIILSLSTSHSFALDDVKRYLHSASVRDVLLQALLDAPMFGVRWRWSASIALALPRYTGGRKVAPQIQRMKSEDLLAAVFPDQVACAENLVGERVVPDHPLVAQTIHDCLHEAMDIDGLVRLLGALERGEVQILARDLNRPSPLAAEVLNARPYAFLDDAPLEERRTQAVFNRRWEDPASAADIGRLDAEAIAAVRAEAWPLPRNADEMLDALNGIGFVADAEARANAGWSQWLAELAGSGRATQVRRRRDGTPEENRSAPWTSAERLPQWSALFPDAAIEPAIRVPDEYAKITWEREAALLEIVRGRIGALGPVQAADFALSLGVAVADVEAALLRLEAEGSVMRGRFSAHAAVDEWCERHLLARIHRYTVNRLRREIEPVAARDFMRFLFDWQRVAPGSQAEGPEALTAVVAQLEGFEAPAAAWEDHILPTRVRDYDSAWLDQLCGGRVVWAHLDASSRGGPRERGGPVRTTSISLMLRPQLDTWMRLSAPGKDVDAVLSWRAQAIADCLQAHGASYFDDLVRGSGMLASEVEDALGELVATGSANCDGYAGLRALLVTAAQQSRSRRGRRAARSFGLQDAGRWAPLRRAASAAPTDADGADIETVARTLLRRYGVVFGRMLEREAHWLPPWRELLRVLRRLEARGEIRGGRFVEGMAGEQFALPDALGLLRAVRNRKLDGTLVCVCGADPLNLVGSVIVGAKLPNVTGSRVLYRDGVPVARRVAGIVESMDPGAVALEWSSHLALVRDQRATSALA